MPAAKQDEEDDAEGPEVDGRSVRLLTQVLWRHVRHRAVEDARAPLQPGGRLHLARQPEVAQLDERTLRPVGQQ